MGAWWNIFYWGNYRSSAMVIKGKSLFCKKCKYLWIYKGKSKYFATCPRCHNLINVNKLVEETNGKEK